MRSSAIINPWFTCSLLRRLMRQARQASMEGATGHVLGQEANHNKRTSSYSEV